MNAIDEAIAILRSRDDVDVAVVEPKHSPSPRTETTNVEHVGGSSLAQIARAGMSIVIAFTDATRSCPDRLIVGMLLDQLAQLGIERSDITLLCAVGLHRPITHAELLDKLGEDIVATVRIESHNALGEHGFVDLGSIDGLPVVVNRRCIDADLLIATGVVEPHQYAGYSGGAKTVIIGCGGERTINATHGPAMLDDPRTRLGSIDGNPFQSFVRAAAERIGLRYVVNVLLDEGGAVVATAAGSPVDVHNALVARARQLYEVAVPTQAHIAIAGIGEAKAVNLYQASRAATYLALADATPLHSGAPIILPAAIPEGAGLGTGEQRFLQILSQGLSPQELLEQMRRTGFAAGEQRAYVLAQTLLNHPVIVVGAEHPEVVEACGMIAAADMDAGLAIAEQLSPHRPDNGRLKILIVPRALLTLPRLSP